MSEGETRKTEERTTNAQAVAPSSEKGVMRMRITFHIGTFTVSIIVKRTHKKNNRHSDK